MKRMEVEEEKVFPLTELPNEVQTLILLHLFNHRIESTRKWYQIERFFRSFPQFGKTEVKPLFFRNIHFLSPDIFPLLYRNAEHIAFWGLREYVLDDIIKDPFYIKMIESMSELRKLDITAYPGRVLNLTILTNLTDLTCKDLYVDIDGMTQLRRLKLDSDRFHMNDKMKLIFENLIEFDIGRIFPNNGKYYGTTSDIFQYLMRVEKLSWRSNTHFSDSHSSLCTECFNIDQSIMFERLINVTSLNVEGSCTGIRDMICHLPNLTELTLKSYVEPRGLLRVDHSIVEHLTSIVNLTVISCIFQHDSIGRSCIFPNLEKLSDNDSGFTSDYYYEKFPNLNNLSIERRRRYVLDEFNGLEYLTNLHSLRIKMSNIHDIIYGYKQDEAISSLSQSLTHLDLRENEMISDRAILGLTNLKRLDISLGTQLSRNAMNRLPSLTEIGLTMKDWGWKRTMLDSLDNPNLKILYL